MRLALCADVGSTYTKVIVVDLDGGAVVGAADHPTTATTDVLDGLDAAAAGFSVPQDRWYVCSSAGGGLRLAVVGYESLVTAQAGHRVGLSAGARVVHVSTGPLSSLGPLRAARPDVVLLVGGTDGGDAAVLAHNAARLARGRWRVPVVLAGNADARESLSALLSSAGVPVTATDNVLPRIGVLAPEPARAAIRSVFLSHVIGGKRLSRGRRFPSLVRAATPDAVLTGVETLADHIGGDLLVVDVGGATTDVYSVLTPDGRTDDVAGALWRSRTVEGDLGMRWTAPDVIRAAATERLVSKGPFVSGSAAQGTLPNAGESGGPVARAARGPGAGGPAGGRSEGDGSARPATGAAGELAALAGTAGELAALEAAAAMRAATPGFVPDSAAERAMDRRIAALAATVAVRRHARGPAGRTGRDLRDVRLLVGSGGVLRHGTAGEGKEVLDAVLTDYAGGWPVPRAARPVIDTSYVLAAAGLLAADHPAAARALLDHHLAAA
ncbi:glutamate mutase L [Asanoa sp. WMMD1127]|uniref:glutamate mutase L n=1 Tax=Asanoa sp. WMMD1127 TaxID=3016107 RepID=UPI002417FE47|nr:glutamate mutase L [Asanoa sp. WMMD1127]MDG4826126.1 glutamate mutase L [Asanoa sp. WMMD1127]